MNSRNSSAVEWPVSFRVFGIGDKTRYIIDEINSWGYQGVKTIIFGEEEISPSDEDEMVIFINPDNYDISLMTQSFFQADILTLVIATPGFNEIINSYDALCITDQSYINNTVLGILYTLFHQGYITFDYYDLLQLIKNQERFKVLLERVQTNNQKLESLMHHFKEVEKQCGTLENIAIIFTFNEITRQSLTTDDLCFVQETTRTLPETVNIKWSIVIDKKIKENQIQMIAIFSGRNLNF